MATKNNVDTTVAERRLRPIYDWLDNGNNKKACQEAEKVLKKQPNFHCAMVLKGLALLRLGKEQECEALLNSVLQDGPTDDPTLQAMTICYREMNKPDMICNLYAAASKKDPNNEELLTHLFMAYVRIADYQKQHLTALALYKLKPKNPYYFWAVMSVVMQAHKAADNKEKQLVLLALAERMVEKLVRHGKIEAEQEVQLYIMILEMQGKLKEALDVVEGPLGEKLQSYIVVPIKRVDLLMKLGRWKEANVTIKKLLRDDMDNWSLYVDYLNTVFHLIDGENSESDFESGDGEKPDKTTADCVRFLSQLQEENCRLVHRLRGPYLAQLEFFAKLKARGENAEPYLGDLVEMLIMYFHEFGEKQCSLNDLRKYLHLLGPNEVSDFLSQISKIVQLEEGQLPSKKVQMLQYISNMHMTRYLGFHEALSCKSKLQLATNLMRYYHNAVQFNAAKMLPTDIQHNDPFALMVAHLMNDVWMETGLSSCLRDAIVVLEHALTKSPSNFQIKLFLIKLYNRLGVSKAAHSIYELLDIKHMQLDSLGYLQCWPLLLTGQYQLATQLYEATIKFFNTNHKDSADHLAFSYKFGSFLKISEFVEFRDRLNNSLHNSLVAVEKKLLEILHTASFQKTLVVATQVEMVAKEKVDWSRFVDNRDFDVCWTADPPHRRITPEVVKTCFRHDLHYLRYRTLLLSIIVGLADLTSITAANYIHRSSKFCSDTKNSEQSGDIGDINSNAPSSVYLNGAGEEEKSSIIDKSCIDNNNVTDVQKQKQDPREVLELLVEELRSFSCDLEANELPLPKNCCIASPDESRIFAVMNSSYTQFLLHLLQIVISLSSGDKHVTSVNGCISAYDGMIKDAVTNLEKEVSKLTAFVRTTDATQLVERQEVLTSLTLIIEMVCIATIVCGTVHHIALQFINSLVKKGKKKKETTVSAVNVPNGGENQRRIECVKQLIQTISGSLHSLDRLIVTLEDNWKDTSIKEDNIYCLLERLELSSNEISQMISSVDRKISESYQGSLTEIHTVLKAKIKYLSELSL